MSPCKLKCSLLPPPRWFSLRPCNIASWHTKIVKYVGLFFLFVCLSVMQLSNGHNFKIFSVWHWNETNRCQFGTAWIDYSFLDIFRNRIHMLWHHIRFSFLPLTQTICHTDFRLSPYVNLPRRVSPLTNEQREQMNIFDKNLAKCRSVSDFCLLTWMFVCLSTDI